MEKIDWGDWVGCLGNEPQPELYVQHIVEIMREVRRVLHPSGCLFLNLGDSYSGYHGNSQVPDADAPSNKPGYIENMRGTTVGLGDLKPKDLIGIPWMVAFALRADSWYLRSEITLTKLNGMPESCEDRPTSATEKLFLFSKSERYFFDNVAVREKAEERTLSTWAARKSRGEPIRRGDPGTSGHVTHTATLASRQGRNIRNWWPITTSPNTWAVCKSCHRVDERWPKCQACGGYCLACFELGLELRHHDGECSHTDEEACPRCLTKQICPRCGSNEVTGHFAAFGRQVVEPCILAGTSAKGVCGECAAPWVRTVECIGVSTTQKRKKLGYSPEGGISGVLVKQNINYAGGHNDSLGNRVTTGWQPSCSCNAALKPALVFDTFLGSGSTGVVAQSLGRRFVGLELSPDYIRIAKARTRQANLFAVTTATLTHGAAES